MAEKPGPEQFAPARRRLQDELKDGSKNIVSVLTNERADAAAESVAANAKIDEMIRQIAADSLDQIDRVIRDLESVRDMMRSEAQRVSREFLGFASLGHSTTTAMKVISESLQQWKSRSSNKVG